jgi:hypothetical protein
MTVAPLVWLLVFDLIVGLIWWGLGQLGVSLDARLAQVMIGLIIIINVVVVIVWLLGMLGYSPNLMGGPFHRLLP